MNLIKKLNVIILAGFFSLFFLLGGCVNKTSNETNLTTIKFYNGDKQIVEIKAEAADTIWKQSIGLMNRTSLPEDRGMLFKFSFQRNWEFFMKDTLMPLDMIFLDKDMRIIEIIKDIPPCKTLNCPIYSAKLPSTYAIEVNAGFAERYNITNQTKVAW